MSKTLTFKNTLYNIIDSGDIGNGWKYVEVIDKKQAFSLPKCLYYKGKSMKNLLSYTDYVNHLDMGKDFINDFVKDIFRECYPGSKNPICKVKESLMVGGNITNHTLIDLLDGNKNITEDVINNYKKETNNDIYNTYFKTIYPNVNQAPKKETITFAKKFLNDVDIFLSELDSTKSNEEQYKNTIDKNKEKILENHRNKINYIIMVNFMKKKLEEHTNVGTKNQALNKKKTDSPLETNKGEGKKTETTDIEKKKQGEDGEVAKTETANKDGDGAKTANKDGEKTTATKKEAATEDNKVQLPGYLAKLFKISGDEKQELDDDTILYFKIKNHLDVTDKLLYVNNEEAYNKFLFQNSGKKDELYTEKLIDIIDKLKIQKKDKYYKLKSKKDLKEGDPVFSIIEKLIIRDIIKSQKWWNKHKGDYNGKSHFLNYIVKHKEYKQKENGRTLFRIEDKEAAAPPKKEVVKQEEEEEDEDDDELEQELNELNEFEEQQQKENTDLKDKEGEEGEKKEDDKVTNVEEEEENQDGNKEKNEEFKNKVKNAEVELDKKMRDDEKMKKNKDNADALNQLVLENNKNKKKIKS